MSNYQEKLSARVVRHGEMAEGPANTPGGKPPYEEFVAFYKGKRDPNIDFETTERIIRQEVASEKLATDDGTDVIICSPTKRTEQTMSVKECLTMSVWR